MEEDNRKSDVRPYNATSEKMHRTPQQGESSRRDAKSHSEEVKRQIHYTPQNRPDKYQKTPQSSGSYRKEAKSESESNKRKGPPSHGESQDKISKVGPSGKFVNALIGQWSKYTGIPTPLAQQPGVQESAKVEEMRRLYAAEERKIQLLQKKLQIAEESITSLSTSREIELRAKEEILRQLNADWESITKYYYEISESLKGFQQHKENLSALYNNIILKQQLAIKIVQDELSNLKLKDEEQRSIVTAAESKVINQEKRIQEIMIVEVELKKQLENVRSNAVSEKNRLNNVHAEERVELIKKQEKLTSVNEELLLQLKSVAEEKVNSAKLFDQKDKEIAKLEEEISTRKNKNEELLCENAELAAKYKELVDIKEELSKQLESKVQEIERLLDNLNTRQEIESSLAKDLDMIENKYRTIQSEYLNMVNTLKETQTRNVELEKSIQDIKYNKEMSVTELNKRIEILTKEKEAMFLEKLAKIQETENSEKYLQEKYELEVSALKKDFDTKLSEMKKTTATQNFEFTKLNENLTKEKEAILSEKLAKIEEVEKTQKSLQEKHESEMSALKKDFNTKLSEMKKTIATQKSTLTKLNDNFTKEKEAILLEKRAKIQDLENSQKSLQEKHELEVSALKNDFDTKLSEMKKTIATQNSAFAKLNENYNKMNEENLDRRVKQYTQKGYQDNLKEKSQLLVESKFAGAIRTYETGSQPRLSQNRDKKGQLSQVEKKTAAPKRASKNKLDMSSEEKLDSIYDFENSDTNHELPKILSQLRPEKRIRFNLRSPPKLYDSAENSSSTKAKEVEKSTAVSQPKQEQKEENTDDTSQKRRIFKTRGAMVRQYATPRKNFKN